MLLSQLLVLLSQLFMPLIQRLMLLSQLQQAACLISVLGLCVCHCPQLLLQSRAVPLGCFVGSVQSLQLLTCNARLSAPRTVAESHTNEASGQ